MHGATVKVVNTSCFLSVERLKALGYSVAIENKETLQQHVLSPVRPFVNPSPGPMKVCDSPLSDVSMCALIGVQDILIIPCEL
jgi:hypothetical protein